MTATTERLVTPLTPTAPGRVGPAIRALALIEARRLVLHPLMLLGLAGTAWQLWTNESATQPLLHRSSVLTPGAIMPLAGATLIAANLAALRSARHHTDELYSCTSVSARGRTAAHLLSVVPMALLAAVLTSVVMLVLATHELAAGRIVPLELATGVVAVLIGGWIGVALARFTRLIVAAPLVALALWVLHIAMWISSDAPLSWLAVVAMEAMDRMPGYGAFPPNVDLLGRPAGAHLLYVVVVAAVVAALALGRSATNRRTAGMWTATSAFVLAAACAAQVATAPDRGEAWSAPGTPALTCQEQGPSSYCYFPGFSSRVPILAELDRSVRGKLGEPAAQRPVRIEQKYLSIQDANKAELAGRRSAAGPVRVEVDWRRGDAAHWDELGIAVEIARRLLQVGPSQRSADQPCTRGGLGGVAWWAATLAAPDGRDNLQTMLVNYRNAPESGWHLTPDESRLLLKYGRWLPDEVAQGLALLDKPEDDVRTLVNNNLAKLGDPKTSTADAAKILGVPAPTQTDPSEQC
jgi:hypothetical protein